MVSLVLLILALVFLALATVGLPAPSPRFNYLAAGLFCFILAQVLAGRTA
jgi:hypothetical protein